MFLTISPRAVITKLCMLDGVLTQSNQWALYGGMHQHDTVKFLLSQGAQVDDE